MRADTDRPLFVLAQTDPVRGLPIFAERSPTFHYLRFASSEERDRYQAAYEEMCR